MKKILFSIFAVITLTAHAQVEKAEINELLFKQGGLLYTHADYGVSIGVVKGNKTFYITTGKRAGSKKAIDQNTLFEVGSVTKTFTGLLLAQQIAGKHISANAYMDAYLPPHFNLAPKLQHQVKLTDLASHQSGLPNLSNDEYINDLFKQNPSQPFSLVNPGYIYQVLKRTKELDGHHDYHYNNYAYALLGLLLQNATHQSYEQLLKSQLIRPLGLKQTYLGTYGSGNIAGRFTTKGESKPAMILNTVAAAGGLRSNAADMLKYVQAQLNPPASLKQAINLSHKRYYSDNKHVVGLGWEIYPHYLEKSGDTFGNSALLRFSTRNKVGIVILSDHQDAQLLEDIADAVFAEIEK
ncbi:serine hydrolase domain-containing protein [Mucilaginibacter koreensis]